MPANVLGITVTPPGNLGLPQSPLVKRRLATLPAKVVTVAFPASLAVAVVAFLLFQGRLDSRDPRLITAPLDGDELLSFQ